jgi:uncharacterized protein YcfL
MKKIETFLMLAAMAVAGCATGTVNTVARDQPEGHPNVVADRRVITDPSLNAYVQPIGVSESQVGDLTKIQVEVYNTQTDPVKFYYKFEWYDDQEMVVDSPMSIWTDRTIQAGEQIPLVGVAPNPRAKDFRLKLQLSPDN